MRLNRVAVLATAALLPLGVSGCSVIGNSADKSPVVIGADLELSGADAAIGVTYQRALQLKIDQLNAAGGADGHPLRLDVKDNHSDPTVSVANIGLLTGESGIAAIVTGACTECLVAATKTIEDKQIPTISLAAAAPVNRPVSDHRYIFKLNPNSEDDADLLANELKSAGIHKYALLTTDDLNGDDAQRSIRAAAAKLNANAASVQLFKSTDTDLTQPVHQALAKEPESLVISAFPDQAGLAATTARQLGFKGSMYFDALAAGDLFQPRSSAAATSGVRMIAPQTLVIDNVIATSPAKTVRKQWFNDYTSKYGNFSGYSLYAADAAQLVASAIQSTQVTGHDQLRDAIEGTQTEGVTGPLRFTPDNHSGLTPQALTTVVVTDGRWRLLLS